MKEIANLMREHKFFDGLKDEWIELMAGCGHNVHLKTGNFIFRAGEDADYFYIIRRGQIALETDIPGRKPAVLQTVSEGEIMGWSWLFPPYINSHNARIVKDVSCVVFDGRCLRGKCETNPAFGFELMKRFSQIFVHRLRSTQLQVLDMYKGRMA